MGVDRCVCHGVTFAELKRIARRTGAGMEGLQARTGCGRGCGLCIPYIRIMLETGRTDLPVIEGGAGEEGTAEADSAPPPGDPPHAT
jgi:bacterioferritin-associated ferredoxin